MSELLQSGLHPDADQLNAFVEHALPSHEREQTLAHLAVCAGCRSIVALSLPPVEETAQPQAEPLRRPLFSGWNLAWPVAVALAALVLIVMQVHNAATTRNENAMRTERAQSHPPAALAPPPLTSLPSVEALPPRAATANPARPPVVTQAVANAKRPEAQASADDTASSKKASDGTSIGSGMAAAGYGTASAGGVVGGMAGGVAGGIAPFVAPQSGSSYMAGAAMTGLAAAPPPASRALSQSGQGGAMAMQAGSQRDAVNHPSYAAAAPVLSTTLMLNARDTAPLPSGLPVLSATSSGSLELALDSGSTLFFSNDNGRHWRSVPAQWKGRAIRVSLGASAGAALRGKLLSTSGDVAMGSGVGFAASSVSAADAISSASCSVAGTVIDASGATISNATVVVSEAARQVVRTVKTDSAGGYLVDSLAPGNYRIEAWAPGFERFDLSITLAASQRSWTNLTLQVGSVTETVTVVPAGATPQTHSAEEKKTKPAAAPIRPAALFEITTEAGDRWSSPDGQIWTHP